MLPCHLAPPDRSLRRSGTYETLGRERPSESPHECWRARLLRWLRAAAELGRWATLITHLEVQEWSHQTICRNSDGLTVRQVCASVPRAKKRRPSSTAGASSSSIDAYFLASGQLSETPVAAAPAESLAYV